MSRFILRVKRGDLPVAFNGRTYDDLMDHKDEMVKDAGKLNHMATVYYDFSIFMGRNNTPPFKEFSSFYGKYAINSFGIKYTGVFYSGGTLGTGLYLGLAAHNHSCSPTAGYYFNGSKIVLCVKDSSVKYSKDLTISYIKSIMTRNCRQKQLRSRYYFDCECERCADEEMELLERSGRSDCCPTEGAVLPVDKKFQFLGYWRQPLVCTNCGKKVETTLEQLNECNRLAAELCARDDSILAKVQCQADVEKLVILFDRARLSLSPYNFNLLKFTELVMKAARILNKTSPLVRKLVLAEDKVREKYSVFTVTARIGLVLNILNTECDEACNYPRRIAFAKLDASCQKALAAVHEIYGPEHYLCNEIAQFSRHMKLYYDTSMRGGGGDH